MLAACRLCSEACCSVAPLSVSSSPSYLSSDPSMPGFGQFLDDVLVKSRAGSVDSAASQSTTSSNARYEAVLFPAGFGVAAGERFDDGASHDRHPAREMTSS